MGRGSWSLHMCCLDLTGPGCFLPSSHCKPFCWEVWCRQVFLQSTERMVCADLNTGRHHPQGLRLQEPVQDVPEQNVSPAHLRHLSP